MSYEAPTDTAVQAPPPAPKRSRWRSIGIPVGTGILGLIIGSASASGGNASPATASGPTSTITTTQTETATETAPADSSSTDSAPADFTPSARDFTIGLKIKSKECFGSAGCNVTYEPKLTYKGSTPLPEDSSYEITYRVTGGSDGAQVNTLTTDGKNYDTSDEMVSTARQSTKLGVKITDVEKVS